jgi:hypothetical protein
MAIVIILIHIILTLITRTLTLIIHTITMVVDIIIVAGMDGVVVTTGEVAADIGAVIIINNNKPQLQRLGLL